jgi:putative redox protein
MNATIDKTRELTVSLDLVNERLHFLGKTGENEPISIDYIPPLGDNLGYTSLELLLLSLASCIGSTTLPMLRRMNKIIKGLEITSTGVRHEHYPTGFKTIIVEMTLKSPDTTTLDMDKVISLSKETFCPVWAMLKGNVKVDVQYRITI